jgi:hypothetical protein
VYLLLWQNAATTVGPEYIVQKLLKALPQEGEKLFSWTWVHAVVSCQAAEEFTPERHPPGFPARSLYHSHIPYRPATGFCWAHGVPCAGSISGTRASFHSEPRRGARGVST